MGSGVTEVLATDGDTRLGGDDFDQHIIDWMANAFQTENGIDLRKDRVAAPAPEGGCWGSEGRSCPAL